ncbi:MAG: uracil-DNA glycosylase [Verrucomicrobia bacterium]|jgi:DNA polymerase|nr:uracil-DNA glycosylase [Verrucomicrobiota bacterium]
MERELAAVYDELKQRFREGESSVFLSPESMSFLRERAREQAATKPTSPAPEKKPAASSAPASPKAAPSTPKPKEAVPEVPDAPEVTLSGDSRREQWENLRQRVGEDAWCRSQVKPGKKVVFGVGSLEADIFFCGEAPGADEEVQGEPFVGKAGQLLTKIIQAMGLDRDRVYIGNIMNYRPPMPGPVGNRPPDPTEMAYCLPYLRAQLAIVQPKVVVALGKTAVDGLLGRDPKRRMTRIRGQWHRFEEIPLLPTFHPSYLLRNNSLATKRQVWEDMLAVMEEVGLPVSDKQRGFFQKG